MFIKLIIILTEVICQVFIFLQYNGTYSYTFYEYVILTHEYLASASAKLLLTMIFLCLHYTKYAKENYCLHGRSVDLLHELPRQSLWLSFRCISYWTNILPHDKFCISFLKALREEDEIKVLLIFR